MMDDFRDKNHIAKTHQESNTDTSVPWVTFTPWHKNTVDWEKEFAIYASNSDIKDHT